jgi:phytoene dehydrogenase-like protein
MVNAPNNTGQDWDSIIQTARQNVLQKLSGMLGRDIRPLIRCESILDPRSIEAKTGSYLGALYGSSSNNRMSAFLRHANFSRQIKNLYFCGGSVHPGGGIPLCVLSAKIVDEVIHGK